MSVIWLMGVFLLMSSADAIAQLADPTSVGRFSGSQNFQEDSDNSMMGMPPSADSLDSSLPVDTTLLSEEEAPSEGISPVLDITPLKKSSAKGEMLYSLELRDVSLADLFRVIAHDYNLNVLIDKEVSGEVTASFTNITLKEALNSIADMYNITITLKGNVLFIQPHLLSKIFALKYVEAKSILEPSSSAESEDSDDESSDSDSSSLVTGGGGETESGSSSEGSEDDSQETALTAPSTIYDLLSLSGKVFHGKQPNSIMVIDYPKNLQEITAYLEMVDRKMITRIFKLKYISARELVLGHSNDCTSDAESSEESGEEEAPAEE